jgi:hypothetical protein
LAWLAAMIATQLHKLVELVGADEPVIKKMLAAPKYVISPDVMAIMTRGDVQRSIGAMIEAGIARLPYAPLLVEYSVDPAVPVRRFVLLDELVEGAFSARTALLNDRRFAAISEAHIIVEVIDRGLKVSQATTGDGMAAALAVSIAMLMLNIRGIDKQLVLTDKLNKQREKKGQLPVPRHNVVRIGTIYDRSGAAHTAGAATRHMPVHLRSGYVRNQACGPGLVDHRPVYIPPVLVNYREGSSEPVRMPVKEIRT